MTGQPVSGVLDAVAWTALAVAVAANVLGAALVSIDKRRAQAARGRRRIPESRLIGLSFLGGWPLMALAMTAWRHKTRKPAFLARFWLAASPSLLLAALLAIRTTM